MNKIDLVHSIDPNEFNLLLLYEEPTPNAPSSPILLPCNPEIFPWTEMTDAALRPQLPRCKILQMDHIPDQAMIES